MLDFIIIFNFITNLSILVYVVYKIFLHRIYFEWERTLWECKIYGVSAWWKTDYFHKRILFIRFMSKKREEEIDER